MRHPEHPADALELALAGVVTGDATDDLLGVVATLRSTSAAIGAPPGLRARRGALVARGAPATAKRAAGMLGRRIQAFVMAGAVAAAGSFAYIGTSAAISWLGRVLPDAPATHGSSGDERDGTDAHTPPPSASSTATPAGDPQGVLKPDPVEVDAVEEPPRRMPDQDEPDDELDDDDEEEEDDDTEDELDEDDRDDTVSADGPDDETDD